MADSLKLDEIAAERLKQALFEHIQGKKTMVVSTEAWIQAQLAQATIFGLVRMLAHKNVISGPELARSLAWAYDERRMRLQEKGGEIIVPDQIVDLPPVTVAGKN